MPYNLHPFNKTMANKMTAKKLMTAVCVAALCGGVWATDEAKPVPTSTANAEKEVEVEEKDDSPLVAVEAGLAFDSRFMTYNVIDGKDPIVRPSGRITFFDWVYFNVEALFDMTKGNGKRGGYGNRAGRWTILDSSVGLAHDLRQRVGAYRVGHRNGAPYRRDRQERDHPGIAVVPGDHHAAARPTARAKSGGERVHVRAVLAVGMGNGHAVPLLGKCRAIRERGLR